MARRKFTQRQAIDYLRTNANWLSIQMDQPRPTDPASLKPATVIRYAHNFYVANELDAREFNTLAEARGHGAGEHHAGRKQKRSQGYQKPYRLPRGRFNQPIAETAHKPLGVWRTPGHPPRVHAGYIRITSGEGMAKRELILAAQRKQTVFINVMGPSGDLRSLFSKSGYRADLLLEAAGFTYRNGKWHKKRPDASLEDYLLKIVNIVLISSPTTGESWGRIRQYQILVDEEATPVRLRRKRDAWPSTDPRFKAGVLVASLPTKSVRKARNRNK